MGESIRSGIDLSLRSPGVCIIDHKCKRIHFWTIKQRRKDVTTNTVDVQNGPYKTYTLHIKQHAMTCDDTTTISRCVHVAEMIRDELIQHKVTHVSLEGHAYSKFTRGATTLKELTGILKYLLHKARIEITIVSPTRLKRQFCGVGNAKKDVMYEAFLTYQLPNLYTCLKLTPSEACIKAPVSDMVDAFALALSR